MNTFKINNRFNTMNLLKRSGDKELFSGTLVEENTLEYDIENKYSLFEINFLSKQRKNYQIIDQLDNKDIEILNFFYNIVLILFVIVALNTYFVIKN